MVVSAGVVSVVNAVVVIPSTVRTVAVVTDVLEYKNLLELLCIHCKIAVLIRATTLQYNAKDFYKA